MAEEKQSTRKQATQETLLESAYSLFASKGFSNTSTREIAEMAGVNELTLFRHFTNKYNLLTQVLARFAPATRMEQFVPRLKDCSFEEGFYEFGKALLSQLEEKYPMIRLMIIEATANPELKLIVGPVSVRLRQTLMEHLQRGVAEGKVRKDLDLELVSQSFLWIFLSYVMIRSDVGQKFCPFRPDEVVKASTEIFLRGLKPEPV